MIVTERLELVPGTVALMRAALEGSDALATSLGAQVPATWPPEYLDPPAFEYTLARLTETGGTSDWWLHFILLAERGNGRTLIGSAGYKGPPSEGTVEVGYGIVSDQRRRGYATETVRGLVARAFELPQIERVIAETLPELVGSIGVLVHCGFRFIGDGSEPGVIRYELTRAEHASAASRRP